MRDGGDPPRPTRRAVLAATAAAGLLAGCEQPPGGDGTPTPRFGYGGTPTGTTGGTPTGTTGGTPTGTTGDTPTGTPDPGDSPTPTATGTDTPTSRRDRTPLPESVDDYGEQRYGEFGYGGVPPGGAR